MLVGHATRISKMAEDNTKPLSSGCCKSGTQAVKALVVLPTYNEAQNIAPLITEILGLGEGIGVCVVDDSSPDGTADAVRQLQPKINAGGERLHLIVRARKDGRGGAVRTGILWGLDQHREQGFDAFVEMDCDFSHPPSDIPQGLAMLTQADVVMGCRYPDGQIVGWPLRRRVLSKLANTLARVLIKWSIHDYTGGFRFYSRRSAAFMCQQPQRHKGYIYLSETIAAFLKNGMTFRCFPIRFVNRARGASNTDFREVRAALTGILQIAWRYRFGE